MRSVGNGLEGTDNSRFSVRLCLPARVAGARRSEAVSIHQSINFNFPYISGSTSRQFHSTVTWPIQVYNIYNMYFFPLSVFYVSKYSLIALHFQIMHSIQLIFI